MPNARLAVLVSTTLVACHGGATNPHGGHRAAPAPAAPAMTEAAIAMVIAPGKTAAWQAALAELTGPRYAEYDASRRRFGLTAQTTFLQQTPMGDLALIHLTGPDVRAAFHRMSASQDPWDVRWRELTRDLHGVDFATGAAAQPVVEAAYQMDVGATPGSQEFLFAAPLTAAGVDDLRRLSTELMGPRHAAYVEARRQLGVEREAVFLETTPQGAVAVFYWRAPDPRASLRRLAASSSPFDAWLRTQAAALHPVGLDLLTQIASGNTLVGQYPQAR
ncbi:MAG: hypothetical protein R3B06_26665 [Kofleriaceae bacterium]